MEQLPPGQWTKHVEDEQTTWQVPLQVTSQVPELLQRTSEFGPTENVQELELEQPASQPSPQVTLHGPELPQVGVQSLPQVDVHDDELAQTSEQWSPQDSLHPDELAQVQLESMQTHVPASAPQVGLLPLQAARVSASAAPATHFQELDVI